MSALVILGAGASYDSVADLNKGRDLDPEMQPPLADSLFENRLAFANVISRTPHMGAIAATLRDQIAGGEALEDELAKLDKEARFDPRSAQQLMAVRFYLQSVTGMCGDAWRNQARGVTNFDRLVDAMIRWSTTNQEPTLFVTFNYDTMLEKAIEQELRFSFQFINSYVARPDLKVFKLHGSVDWGHRGLSTAHSEGVSPSTMDGVIELAPELEVPESFEIKRDWNVGRRGEFWIPALAVPVRKKSVFECPREHLGELNDLLPTVDRVLVVGWAAMEEHFLALLNDRLRGELKAAVVACGSADAATETWGRLSRLPGGRMLSVRGSAQVNAAITFSEMFSDEGFQGFLEA